MSPSRVPTPSAVVGLDVGNNSIKVAEAKFTKDGITITALGTAQTPFGAIENEMIVDPQALGKAIKTLLAETGIKTKKCVSSVAGQSQVVLRVVDVPAMSQQELAETMKWEVEKFSFSPDGVEMDFQPLVRPGADPNAQNMSVLLAVAQRELVENHVKALSIAGLQPMAIDVELLASGRSLIETSKSASGDDIVAIIDIGSNNTEMGIFEGGALTFPSPPLTIAGISITREISEALGQTVDEAEITKKEYAVVDLDKFSSSAPVDDQDDVNGGAVQSEPTSYDSSFQMPSAFDADVPAAAEPEPEVIAADLSDLDQFNTNTDSPAFETQDTLGGPAFDLGESVSAAPAGPSFDLGGNEPAVGPAFDLGESDPAPAAEAPAFDLGGDVVAAEPAPPVFDLDDDSTGAVIEETASPSFDLSDVNPEADAGEHVDAQEPVYDFKSTVAPIESGSMEEKVFFAMSNVLVDLANELRRSLDYYYVNNSRMPERIFLCGGTAKMPRLDEFLSRELGVPVEVADPTKNLAVKTPGYSPQYLREISPLFSVSIGLAIRDMIG